MRFVTITFDNDGEAATDATLLVVFRVFAQRQAVERIRSGDIFPCHFGEAIYQHGIGAVSG